ncbi:NAD(P)H-dependent flavin oxidoreductase [Bdellovibrio sp. HCB-110]|uniref:NAD(P)H-dependent flavin oxidoreductase n=1 Tax=Bdellovibrio sp. HCB-110 TaxID=3391182 RepID=UPI0039B66111
MKLSLQERLKLPFFPVIQAPMAGGFTPPSFIAAVCEEGGLGSIGAGYLSPESLREQIREVKKLTSKAFAVNLFIPTPVTLDQTKIEESKKILLKYHQELGISAEPKLFWDEQLFEKQFQVVLEEKVPVFSFAFGFLSAEKMQALKSQGIFIIGTATSLEEGLFLEQQGCDAIAAQGSEAGGHRGSFLDGKFPLVRVWDLVDELVDHVHIPVLAAGGIINAEGVHKARQLGASGVQVGTAFLVCKESSASPEFKKKLLTSPEGSTVLTKSFSGRWARGVENRFMKELEPLQEHLPDYPLQNSLTQVLRKHALEKGQTDFLSLWAGEGVGHLQELSIHELMQELTK